MKSLFNLACAATIIFLQPQLALGQEIIDQQEYNQNIKLTNNGWKFIESNLYKEAVESFTQAINFNDGNIDALSGIATAFLKLKKYDSAKFYVEKALIISPKEADLNYLYGNINIRQQKYKNAINSYSKALANNYTSEVKIDLANCYFNRGNAYLFSEQYKEAIKDFSQSLSHRPFANSYHNRGIAFRHLRKQQEACDNFNQAVKLGSEQSKTYLKQYCTGVKPRKINDIENLTEDVSNKQSNSDTISVTLYYNDNWELTSKHNRVTFRKAQLRISDKKFVASFVDYYPDGTVMVQGEYDSHGSKTGWFKRYYENGNIFSKGQFKNNKQFGRWTYFYDDESIKENILFNGSNFIIEEYYDKDGEKKVVKGTGIWTHIFPVSIVESYTLTAPHDNGLRIDKWKLKDQNGQLRIVESYDNGMFKSGKQGSSPGFMEKYQETQLTASLFYPSSYDQIENFTYSTFTYYGDYPFLDHLPERQALISMKDTYLNETDKSVVDFDVVENHPSPEGGMNNFYKYIGKTLNYPKTARAAGAQGRVFVQFIVNEDGSISNVRTIKGIGYGCDKEAERVIKNSPHWNPGEQKGNAVKVRMILPITFKLS